MLPALPAGGSSTHPLTHSPTYLPIHPPTHPLSHLSSPPPTHSPTLPPIFPSTHPSAHLPSDLCNLCLMLHTELQEWMWKATCCRLYELGGSSTHPPIIHPSTNHPPTHPPTYPPTHLNGVFGGAQRTGGVGCGRQHAAGFTAGSHPLTIHPNTHPLTILPPPTIHPPPPH